MWKKALWPHRNRKQNLISDQVPYSASNLSQNENSILYHHKSGFSSAEIHDLRNENRNQNITTLGCAWKHTPPPQRHVYTAPPNAFSCNCKVLERLFTSLKIIWCVIFFHLQPSPVKKERSPRPQSFCHSSSVSPQEKLSLPGYLGHRDKQRLSYGAFANPVYSTSTDTPASPVSEGPTIASKTTTKGINAFMHEMHKPMYLERWNMMGDWIVCMYLTSLY